MSIIIKNGEASPAAIPVSVVATATGLPADPGALSAGDLKVALNGGAEANAAGTWTHRGNGHAVYVPHSSEIAADGTLSVRVAKSGYTGFGVGQISSALPQEGFTTFAITSATATSFTISDLSGLPDGSFVGCHVYVKDGAGVAQLATILSFSAGVFGIHCQAGDQGRWITTPSGGDNVLIMLHSNPVPAIRNNPIARGTAQAGGAATITLAANDAALDSEYDGYRIKITGGTGAGQTRLIGSYVSSTKVATVATNWGTNPNSTSVYEIYGTPKPILAPVTHANATVGAVGTVVDFPLTTVNNTALGVAVLTTGLTPTRMGNLDNLDATVSSRSTYAGGDTSGTTTLLSRLTSTRAGLLDNLDATVSSRATVALIVAADLSGSQSANTLGYYVKAGGASGDPLSSTVPGSYPAGSAGYQLGRLGTAQVTTTAPVDEDGETIKLKQGDEYTAAVGRAIEFVDADNQWPTLTGWTAKLKIDDGDASVNEYTASITVATGNGKTVIAELTAAQTATLAAGGSQAFQLQLFGPDDERITAVSGRVVVERAL